MSISRQCDLLGLARSSAYYEPVAISEENLELLRLLDEQYTRTPFYGSRRMTAWLQQQGYAANRKRVVGLMDLLGLEAVYQKPRLSDPNKQHKKYPYLLRGLVVNRPNLVWSADITYIRLRGGFVYLVAVIDWFSRYVLSWELSTTLDTSFCLAALETALKHGEPYIFNTDQGSQFTSDEFTGRLHDADVLVEHGRPWPCS